MQSLCIKCLRASRRPQRVRPACSRSSAAWRNCERHSTVNAVATENLKRMIDYETYCKIRDHHLRQGLSIIQTADALGLHRETVSKWCRREHYQPPPRVQPASRV